MKLWSFYCIYINFNKCIFYCFLSSSVCSVGVYGCRSGNARKSENLLNKLGAGKRDNYHRDWENKTEYCDKNTRNAPRIEITELDSWHDSESYSANTEDKSRPAENTQKQRKNRANSRSDRPAYILSSAVFIKNVIGVIIIKTVHIIISSLP